MYENVIAVYKNAQDVYFYVLGNYDENELILLSALNCLYDALSRLLRCVKREYFFHFFFSTHFTLWYRAQLDKRTMLENLDFVLLAIDELVDDGVLLEADAAQLAQRVAMKSDSDVPLSEQTVSQAIRTGKEFFLQHFESWFF